MSTRAPGTGSPVPPSGDPVTPGSSGKLRSGQLGTTHLVAFVVACAAPLALMAGVGPVALSMGGVGTPSGYLIAGVVLALFAVGYVAMSRHVRNAGAFAAFVGAGLGARAGSGTGVGTLASYTLFTIGQVCGSAYFLQVAIGYFTGVELPWPLLAVVIALVIGYMGYRSVTFSGKTLVVALVLEMVVLVALAIAVLSRGGAEGITVGSFTPEAVFQPGMAVVLVFAFGAFLGIEATAIYAEETREPRRTVPRATYIAVALLGIFYTFVCWTIVLAFGESAIADEAAADPAGLFFGAMDLYVGPFATGLMHVMLFISVFASTLAFHNESTRYMFALGRDGVLPRAFARTHPKTGSPWIAGRWHIGLVIVVVGIIALLGADPYLEGFIYLASAATVGIIATQIVATIAVIAFFRRDARDTTRWQRLIAPSLALLGLTIALVLMLMYFPLLTGTDGPINVILFIPVVAGAVYGVLRERRLSLARKDHEQ